MKTKTGEEEKISMIKTSLGSKSIRFSSLEMEEGNLSDRWRRLECCRKIAKKLSSGVTPDSSEELRNLIQRWNSKLDKDHEQFMADLLSYMMDSITTPAGPIPDGGGDDVMRQMKIREDRAIGIIQSTTYIIDNVFQDAGEKSCSSLQNAAKLLRERCMKERQEINIELNKKQS